MIHKITICGNTETILDSHDVSEIPHEIREGLAIEFVEAASGVIVESSIEILIEVCGDFRQYHGRKFSHQAKMYGQTGGLVSCEIDTPQIVRDLCEKALSIATELLAKEIEAEKANC